MVLEETLVIRNPIDTAEVTRAFKDAGMPVRITQATALRNLISIKGTIRDIKTLLKEEIEQSKKLAEKTGVEEEEEDLELRKVYSTNLSVIEGAAETITEFMEKYQPGAYIPGDEFKEWMSPPSEDLPDEDLDENLDDLDEDLEDDVFQGALDPVMFKFLALVTLDENDIIDMGEEGVTVIQHMECDDLIVTLPGDIMGDIGREALRDHNIVTMISLISAPEYRLEFAPEVVMVAELDDLDEVIEDLEIDEDIYLRFRESLHLKQIAATQIIELIEERGTLTPAEVTELIEDTIFSGTEGDLEISLELSPEFVKGLLGDLKRIGLLRKKGAGFRAA